MVKSLTHGAATVGVVAALALGSAACGSAKQAGGSKSGSTAKSSSAPSKSDGFMIGLLLPEAKTARYEKFDRPFIQAAIKAECPKCTIKYENANGSASDQQKQFDTVLTAGAKVVIVDSVDYKAIASSVAKAKSQGIPVVAYDRLAQGPISAYSGFDNVKVGKFQGQELVKAMAAKGGSTASKSIVMINGDPADPNAAQFKQGAMSALKGKVKIAKSYDEAGWDPDSANKDMSQAITALKNTKTTLSGVYVANDTMAGAAITAIKNSGIPLPPVTGQDAEVTGIQRVLAGQQTMTIYKPIKPEAETAAKFAVQLGRTGKVDAATAVSATGGPDSTTVDNGTDKGIPTVLYTPVAVTKANINDTVIKDGFWTKADICTGSFASACTAAGIG